VLKAHDATHQEGQGMHVHGASKQPPPVSLGDGGCTGGIIHEAHGALSFERRGFIPEASVGVVHLALLAWPEGVRALHGHIRGEGAQRLPGHVDGVVSAA
jgi:hypothetical protein